MVFIYFNGSSIIHKTVIIITINTVTQLYDNRIKKKGELIVTIFFGGRIYKLYK